MGAAEVEDAGAITVIPRVTAKHIKKRSLKNKSLSISFNDKDLKDYVSGFHKRKKKRRKEAQQQLQEKERLKRIERRKKRKQERASVYGSTLPDTTSSVPDESGDDLEQAEGTELPASVSGSKTYDNDNITITVTTSEISHEEDEGSKGNTVSFPRPSGETDKKRHIPVNKKSLKKVATHKSRARPQKKREKRKGKKKRTTTIH